MRAVRVWIADALHDRQVAGLPEPVQILECRVQAHVVIQLENLAGLDPERWPALVVHIVGVRDDGVQSVIAAAELEHDQDGRIAPGLGGPGRLPPQARSGRADREDPGRLIHE